MLTSETEFSFLALCFDKPQLWAFCYEPIDPDAEWISTKVKEYRSKYSNYPNKNTFLAFIKEKCQPQEYKYIIESLNIDIDKSYSMDTVIKYLEEKKLCNGIEKAKELLETHKVKEAKREILKGTELVYSNTFNFFKDTLETFPNDKITTGFKCIDKVLGGGLHKGNLGLFIGPKSSGKSLTMINIGHNALFANHSVLHISFEDSLEQIIGRYKKRFISKISPSSNLFIHVFPTGGAIVSDCEALINVYKPDLVIVDYLNEIGMDKKVSKSEELGNIARSLRGAAQRHNCCIWTAQQAGRHSKFSKENIVAEDAFWSYEPSQVSDVVVTLNQTEEEKMAGIIRYRIDRHRNGPDGLNFTFDINYSEMFLKERKF